MNNDTHFLNHDCMVRAARGSCSVMLQDGAAPMKNLSCTRTAWLTTEQLPNTADSPAMGFFAVSVAFEKLFAGAAWTSISARPQQNSTFVAAAAKYFDNHHIGMPADLLSHVRRTLWHSAINARPADLPASDIGGQYDLNGTVEMAVQDQTQVLIATVNFVVISSVLGIAAIISLLAVLYLFLASNPVPGRLMRDSLVHTLSVPARSPGTLAVASAINLRNNSDQSLDEVLKAGSSLRLRCVLVDGVNGHSGKQTLVVEQTHSSGPEA
jgi:hypothetical protein